MPRRPPNWKVLLNRFFVAVKKNTPFFLFNRCLVFYWILSWRMRKNYFGHNYSLQEKPKGFPYKRQVFVSWSCQLYVIICQHNPTLDLTDKSTWIKNRKKHTKHTYTLPTPVPWRIENTFASLILFEVWLETHTFLRLSGKHKSANFLSVLPRKHKNYRYRFGPLFWKHIFWKHIPVSSSFIR